MREQISTLLNVLLAILGVNLALTALDEFFDVRFDPEGPLEPLLKVNGLVDRIYLEIDRVFLEIEWWVPWTFLGVLWVVEKVWTKPGDRS